MPYLNQKRQGTPLKPTLSTAVHSILPDLKSPSIIVKSSTKKRVRFALSLDPLEESENEYSSERLSAPVTPAPDRSKGEPWRENGSLFGAYTEYLQDTNVLMSDLTESVRPTTPTPEFESSSNFAQTYHIQRKSPMLVVDAITITTSANQLPRLAQPPKTVKKTVKKSPTPMPTFDTLSRPRLVTPTPTPARTTQVKKTVCPTIYKNPFHSSPTSLKRSDLLFPRIKSSNSSERVVRADHTIGSKIVNEYIQAKKVTEVIANPLPGTNNQISYICGHSIIPRIRKASPTYQNHVTNEPYFYQTHRRDQLPQIIH